MNTVCEEIDLSDNYIEGSGAAAIAGVLKDNMFIVNLVSLSTAQFYFLTDRFDWFKCILFMYNIHRKGLGAA